MVRVCDTVFLYWFVMHVEVAGNVKTISGQVQNMYGR